MAMTADSDPSKAGLVLDRKRMASSTPKADLMKDKAMTSDRKDRVDSEEVPVLDPMDPTTDLAENKDRISGPDRKETGSKDRAISADSAVLTCRRMPSKA